MGCRVIKMKKIFAFILIIVSSFLIIGCSPKTYDEISYNELNTMLKNKESFILLVGRDDCSACQSYKPTIEKVIQDYKLDVKYINTNTLSEEENAELLSNFYLTGTPQTIFVVKGKEKDRLTRVNGSQKYSKVVEIMKKNGYIKE